MREGDRLTSDEFMRRWEAMPDLRHAELIDGIVYQAVEPDADGLIRSRCFPGLRLDVAALWRLDLAQVLKVLQLGVASAEHAEFADRLARKTTSTEI